MKKEFYIGQPLIVKATGEKVTFAYDNDEEETPCIVLQTVNYFSHQYCEYDELEPATEFKFSEIIAGLEQGYFDVGTEFSVPSALITITVKQGDNGLCLQSPSGFLVLLSAFTNTMWTRVEPRKEMTIAEIEAELNNGGN